MAALCANIDEINAANPVEPRVQNMADILLEHEGPIAWLRINRPEAHNAFGRDMTALMADRVRELAENRDARVAILCGNGPSFSTGLDVKEFARGELEVDFFISWNRMVHLLRALSIPLIVAIHGHCLGGGTMLTLEADYRLASADMHIGLGALRHGILPGTAPEMLPGIVGAARARRLCLFAEYVDADEALRIGLVDKVVPRESLEGEARQLGERACGFSASALRECKSLLARAGTLDSAGYDRAFAEAQQRCLDARDQN